MNISKYFLVLFLLISMPAHAQNLILTNAQAYTVDAHKSWVEAMAIDENGIITAIGTNTEILDLVDQNSQVVNLNGRMILPGFQDVHLHALEAGINAALCEFDPFDTISSYKIALRECALNTTTTQWVLGAGINLIELLELHLNPVEILDELFPQRPVLILDDIGHGAWLNSVALQLAGYASALDAPNGNIILRTSSGAPNGIVLENAPHRLRNLAFPPTKENLDFAYQGLLDALSELNANGITSLSDAGGYWPQGHHLVWQRAAAQNTLTVRASNALYIYPDIPINKQMDTLKQLYSNDADSLLRFNHAKIYVDGILSQATSALLRPYNKNLGLPQEEESGYLYFEKTALFSISRQLASEGFQLHYHVTGDYGAQLALDAIEQAGTSSGPHRLTHLYMLDPSDLPRFSELNVVADLQLASGALEQEYLDFLEGMIGERVQQILPAGSLIDAGAIVTLSSDWDADELSPLVKIQNAVNREINGMPDVATAIQSMTINAAIALQHADKTGSIEVGKFADLVILSQNIFDIPVENIGTVQIVATLLQGDAVYDPMDLF